MSLAIAIQRERIRVEGRDLSADLVNSLGLYRPIGQGQF